MNFIKTEDIITIENCKTKDTKTFKLVKFKKEYSPVWTYNTKKNAEKSHYTSKIISNADGVSAVSVDTPIGKACYGKSINDIIVCKSPNGEEKYRILNVQRNNE